MIRIDAAWLATAPLDMRAGTDTALARVVNDIEREVKELNAEQRHAIRQQHTKPLLEALHEWMLLQRQKLPDSSATAKALVDADRKLSRFLM
jgi:hypothetical protein